MVTRNKHIANKEVQRLFLTKHYSFNLKNMQFQSSHYRNVSADPWELFADPLRNAEHSFGTAGQA